MCYIKKGVKMDKENIIKNLKNKNVWFELEEHQAVFNMGDLDEVNLKYKNRDAKNIFVRDDKKLNYYLITIKGDKKVDLKQFRKSFNTRNLSFASAEDLMSILKLIPGSVSPLGILNDEKLKVRFFVDKFFLNDNGIIGIHPNENTATLWIKTEDLIEIIKNHGNTVDIIDC